MDEQAFRKQLAEEGYSEAVLIEYAPDTDNEIHTHDFSAKVMVLEGEITVTCADGSATTCGVGDTFQLAAGTPHKEACGPAGVRFLAGRK